MHACSVLQTTGYKNKQETKQQKRIFVTLLMYNLKLGVNLSQRKKTQLCIILVNDQILNFKRNEFMLEKLFLKKDN